jgi:hypothetical protein
LSIADGIVSKAEIAWPGGLAFTDNQIDEFIRTTKVVRQHTTGLGLRVHRHFALNHFGPFDWLCALVDILPSYRRNAGRHHVRGPSVRSVLAA